MFVIYLFIWLQCAKQEFTFFVSWKNQTACSFFLQTDYF